MDQSIPQSVSQHWDVLWYLLTAAVAAGLIEFRIFLYSMRKDLKESIATHQQCQKDLPKTYVALPEFNELTEKFEHHYHEGRPAKVVINNRGL